MESAGGLPVLVFFYGGSWYVTRGPRVPLRRRVLSQRRPRRAALSRRNHGATSIPLLDGRHQVEKTLADGNPVRPAETRPRQKRRLRGSKQPAAAWRTR